MSQTTKRALEASLKNLLAQKPLDKITINDIATDCGINRMTFYYHFKDIYDLVEWSCVEDARKALEGKKTYDSGPRKCHPCIKRLPYRQNFINSPKITEVWGSIYRISLKKHHRYSCNCSMSSLVVAQLVANLTTVWFSSAFSQKLNPTFSFN